jgi:hypothetical protein
VRKIVPIGPLLPAEHHLRVEDRHPAEKWLDNQKEDSVLYVAFGSAVVFSPAQILELTEGLESSGQPFVLVLRLPNGEALDKLSPGIIVFVLLRWTLFKKMSTPWRGIRTDILRISCSGFV